MTEKQIPMHSDPTFNQELDNNRPLYNTLETAGLDTPQGRAQDVAERTAKLTQQAASVTPPAPFQPVSDPNATDLVYLRNNRKQAIDITNPDPTNPGQNLFIPGRAQYMISEGEPFIVIERAVLNRSTGIRTLLRAPIGIDHNRQPIKIVETSVTEEVVEKQDLDGNPYRVVEKVKNSTERVVMALEEISEEQYYNERAEWQEWSAKMNEKFKSQMLSGNNAEGSRAEDEFNLPVGNWRAVEGGRIQY